MRLNPASSCLRLSVVAATAKYQGQLKLHRLVRPAKPVSTSMVVRLSLSPAGKKRGATQQSQWVCQICNPNKRLSNANVNFVSTQRTPVVTKDASDASGSKKRCFDAIVTSPPPQFTDLSSKCDYVLDLVINLTNRTNLVLEQLQSCRADVDELKERAKASEDRILELERVVSLITEQNGELEYKSRQQDDYSRTDNIILHGAPPTDTDTAAMDIIISTAETAKVKIGYEDINACHTLRSSKGDSSRIVCRFVNRWLKYKVRAAVNKAKFTSTVLNFAGEERPVFMTDHLSPQTSKLYGEAKGTLHVKSGGQYEQIWIQNRKIMLRRSEGTPEIELKTRAQLRNLQYQQEQRMDGIQASQ